MAKRLYATKQARPDTCTAIAFLMTRVQAPDKDDWNKLVHLMKHLRGMMLMLPLILSANRTGILKWWVRGCSICNPSQHVRTQWRRPIFGKRISHCEFDQAETQYPKLYGIRNCGCNDFMPAICWTQYFMEAQGYQVQDNFLFQDNKSVILLEKNGKALSS